MVQWVYYSSQFRLTCIIFFYEGYKTTILDLSYSTDIDSFPNNTLPELTFEQFKNLYIDKIVQTNLKVEDLIEGKIYKLICLSNPEWNSLLLCNGKSSFSYRMYISDNYNGKKLDKASWGYTKDNEYKIATQEEGDWLNACIKANKYLPKEEVLKSSVQFEKGKWYKFHNSEHRGYVIGKFNKYNGNCFTCTDWLAQCVHYNTKGTFTLNVISDITEVPLSEIQQYLPDTHPDKKWWETLKKGDIVRCIANEDNLGSREIGKEYVITKDFGTGANLDNIYYKEGRCTKYYEEFELIRRINEIGKWSVGTYVVFTTDNSCGNCRQQGQISEIAELNWSEEDNCCYFKYGDGFSNNSTDDTIKWFAILEEAQAFAKTLVKEKDFNYDDRTGEKYEVNTTTCPDCEGEGKVMTAKLYPSGHTEVWETCEKCNGEGSIEQEEPNDFKQAKDVSDWLKYKNLGLDRVDAIGLNMRTRLSMFVKETDDDKVQLPKFVLNKDYTNYFEKELEN